jgi:epoxyqueuosine reductase
MKKIGRTIHGACHPFKTARAPATDCGTEPTGVRWPSNKNSAMVSAERIRDLALGMGFAVVGIAPAGLARHAEALPRWLDRGYAAGMSWMAREPARRADIRRFLPGAKSVIVAGLSYFTEEPPSEIWNDPLRGRIARYAWGSDYHDVMRPMLDDLATLVHAECPGSVRVCVDTGPVLERDLAASAGLGFIGRNTCLCNTGLGSYVLLGEIVVESEIGDWKWEAGDAFCGPCRLCIESCPSGALVEPYVLDARRCIAYLTIEHRGAIPEDLRPRMGSWIFGCDACQETCPWNAKLSARPAAARFLRWDAERCAPRLVELIELDEAGFRERFAGTPVLRTKRSQFLRNAAVALGNSGRPEARPALERAARDVDPLIREHAAWALEKMRP